jgi:hypothetical protein
MSRNLIFQGKTTYLSYHWYSHFIFPLVQVKKLLQTIYQFLLNLIWSDLIYGKKLDNEIANLFAFLLFCVLSLITYHFSDYISLVLVFSFFIWYLDCWIAKRQYYQKNHKIDIFIYEVDLQQIICCLCLPKHHIQSIFTSFSKDEISYIGLTKSPLLGGAFQEVLDEVWQTEIYLFNGKHFVIDEHLLINDAMLTAKQLANSFKSEIIFTHSQGHSSYVEQELPSLSLSYLQQKDIGIQCQKSSTKWHIYTQWKWSNSWIFIKTLFEKAGFLLFLIFMTGFMIQFGELLNNIILDLTGSDIIIYPDPRKWLIFNWSWRNILELVLFLGIFIYQGWQLSRVKHIYITRYSLKFAIDNQVIDKIKISDIKTSFLINNTEPEIFIIGDNKAINITSFQQQKSAQVFWAYLDESINNFQSQ